MKILEHGKLGFKNKMNVIIIHNNKSRVKQMAGIQTERNDKGK